jgi:hypothetical protein
MCLSAHQQKDENQPQRADFSPFAIRNSLFSEEPMQPQPAPGQTTPTDYS